MVVGAEARKRLTLGYSMSSSVAAVAEAAAVVSVPSLDLENMVVGPHYRLTEYIAVVASKEVREIALAFRTVLAEQALHCNKMQPP